MQTNIFAIKLLKCENPFNETDLWFQIGFFFFDNIVVIVTCSIFELESFLLKIIFTSASTLNRNY